MSRIPLKTKKELLPKFVIDKLKDAEHFLDVIDLQYNNGVISFIKPVAYLDLMGNLIQWETPEIGTEEIVIMDWEDFAPLSWAEIPALLAGDKHVMEAYYYGVDPEDEGTFNFFAPQAKDGMSFVDVMMDPSLRGSGPKAGRKHVPYKFVDYKYEKGVPLINIRRRNIAQPKKGSKEPFQFDKRVEVPLKDLRLKETSRYKDSALLLKMDYIDWERFGLDRATFIEYRPSREGLTVVGFDNKPQPLDEFIRERLQHFNDDDIPSPFEEYDKARSKALAAGDRLDFRWRGTWVDVPTELLFLRKQNPTSHKM